MKDGSIVYAMESEAALIQNMNKRLKWDYLICSINKDTLR